MPEINSHQRHILCRWFATLRWVGFYVLLATQHGNHFLQGFCVANSERSLRHNVWSQYGCNNLATQVDEILCCFGQHMGTWNDLSTHGNFHDSQDIIFFPSVSWTKEGLWHHDEILRRDRPRPKRRAFNQIHREWLSASLEESSFYALDVWFGPRRTQFLNRNGNMWFHCECARSHCSN